MDYASAGRAATRRSGGDGLGCGLADSLSQSGQFWCTGGLCAAAESGTWLETSIEVIGRGGDVLEARGSGLKRFLSGFHDTTLESTGFDGVPTFPTVEGACFSVSSDFREVLQE